MTCYHCQTLKNILYYHNMQYQVDPTDQTPENGQKPLFWLFGSFKSAFLWFLNDPSWPGEAAESWKTFYTITICNIKSIQQTKVQKIAKNLIFGSLDHSKMHLCDIWMILHDLVMLSNAGKHLFLSHYAISSRFKTRNSRKWPKTPFLALWIIQKCIFLLFEWSSMSHIMTKLLTPFSIVKICNIKLIRWTKLKKMANNWMDHSKRPTRRTEKILKN